MVAGNEDEGAVHRASRRKRERNDGESSMDLRKQVYHGIENDERNLGVEAEFAGDV
jgi:hypothetical protein